MKKLFLLFPAFFLIACSTSENSGNLLNTSSPPSKNNPKVVRITEYFDFGCGHCKKASQTMDNLKRKYGKKLKITFRHFPLSPKTFMAAEASECARTQGKFKPFHDLIFENFGVYTAEKMKEIADGLNLNREKFDICLDSGVMKSKVREDQEQARKFGASGTPYFIINERTKIPGAISETAFENLIDKILESK